MDNSTVTRAHELGRKRLTALRAIYIQLADGVAGLTFDGMAGDIIHMDGAAPVYVVPWDRDRLITAILNLENVLRTQTADVA